MALMGGSGWPNEPVVQAGGGPGQGLPILTSKRRDRKVMCLEPRVGRTVPGPPRFVLTRVGLVRCGIVGAASPGSLCLDSTARGGGVEGKYVCI